MINVWIPDLQSEATVTNLLLYRSYKTRRQQATASDVMEDFCAVLLARET